jgi:hypothetical protein
VRFLFVAARVAARSRAFAAAVAKGTKENFEGDDKLPQPPKEPVKPPREQTADEKKRNAMKADGEIVQVEELAHKHFISDISHPSLSASRY